MFILSGLDGSTQLSSSKTERTLKVTLSSISTSPAFFNRCKSGWLSAVTIGVMASCRLAFLRLPSVRCRQGSSRTMSPSQNILVRVEFLCEPSRRSGRYSQASLLLVYHRFYRTLLDTLYDTYSCGYGCPLCVLSSKNPRGQSHSSFTYNITQNVDAVKRFYFYYWPVASSAASSAASGIASSAPCAACAMA